MNVLDNSSIPPYFTLNYSSYLDYCKIDTWKDANLELVIDRLCRDVIFSDRYNPASEQVCSEIFNKLKDHPTDRGRCFFNCEIFALKGHALYFYYDVVCRRDISSLIEGVLTPSEEFIHNSKNFRLKNFHSYVNEKYAKTSPKFN